MADSTGDPVVGATLAGYRIEGRLGRGGMSVVYLARDLALGRLIALKVLAPELSDDARFRERFRLESRLAASIDHPNVIPIYDAGEADGQFYIAMRYVEGTDLRRLIREQGALEPTRAAELVAHIADGLDAAHARGLVHRDVKPSNILIAGPGEHEHVYLADFGLTKAAESEDEARDDAPTLSGTTDYVAPELITDAHAGIGADIYALGCVLYEALTGHVPFPRGSELETLAAHLDEPVPKPSEGRAGFPGALDTVVGRAMAKDPAERYASAAELAAAARATLPSQARSRRLPVLLAAGVAVLASVALAVVLVTRDSGRGLPAPTTEVSGPALQLIDPATSSLVSTVELLDPADEAVVTDDAVWLVDATGGTITRLGQETLAQSKTSLEHLQAEGIGAGLDRIWVTANQPRSAVPRRDRPGGGLVVALAAVDPESLAAREIPVREHPHAFLDEVVESHGALWATEVANKTVERLDPSTRRSRRIALRSVPISLAAYGADVWVVQPGVVSQVDAATGRVVTDHRLPFTPSTVAVDASGVWLADREHDAVHLFDPDARQLVKTIEVGAAPIDLAATTSGLWVVNGGSGTVSRIDPVARAVVDTVEVGSNPTAVAAGSDGVWVAVRGDSTKDLDAYPKVFVFGAGLLEFRGFLPGRPGATCELGRPSHDCIAVSAGAMRALDGTEATWIDAIRERRVRGGSITCAGTVYTGPVTSRIRGNAGKSIVEIAGWGALVLVFDRSDAVFSGINNTIPGGPDCAEFSGRWFGVSGRMAGLHGTWGPPTAKLPPGSFGGMQLVETAS